MISVGTPTVGSYNTAYGGSVLGFNHTTASGTNLLVFGVDLQLSTTDVGIDTATWNGASMTRLVTKIEGGKTRALAIFALVSPSIGAYDVRFHYNGTGAPQATYMFAVDVTGTFSTATMGGNSQTSGADNPSITYTVVGSAGVIFDIFMSTSEGTPGGSQTSIFSNVDPGGGFYRTGASYRAHSGSNTTMSYTGNTAAAYSGIEIIEIPPTTTSTSTSTSTSTTSSTTSTSTSTSSTTSTSTTSSTTTSTSSTTSTTSTTSSTTSTTSTTTSTSSSTSSSTTTDFASTQRTDVPAFVKKVYHPILGNIQMNW